MASVNYKLIKNFFTKEELILLQKYCYNKLHQNKDYQIDPKSFSPCWSYDPLMTSLLDIKLPIVEKESNLKLFPTYSYWRYYISGASLKTHTDRPSCEVSITTCIKKYDDWSFNIENSSFKIKEGDALLYAGCVQKHGRPGVYRGEGMVQAFFHYVDQNGPFTHHQYDNFWKERKQDFTQSDYKLMKEKINERKNS